MCVSIRSTLANSPLSLVPASVLTGCQETSLLPHQPPAIICTAIIHHIRNRALCRSRLLANCITPLHHVHHAFGVDCITPLHHVHHSLVSCASRHRIMCITKPVLIASRHCIMCITPSCQLHLAIVSIASRHRIMCITPSDCITPSHHVHQAIASCASRHRVDCIRRSPCLSTNLAAKACASTPCVWTRYNASISVKGGGSGEGWW